MKTAIIGACVLLASMLAASVATAAPSWTMTATVGEYTRTTGPYAGTTYVGITYDITRTGGPAKFLLVDTVCDNGYSNTNFVSWRDKQRTDGVTWASDMYGLPNGTCTATLIETGNDMTLGTADDKVLIVMTFPFVWSGG
jgi:hypothetical protein